MAPVIGHHCTGFCPVTECAIRYRTWFADGDVALEAQIEKGRRPKPTPLRICPRQETLNPWARYPGLRRLPLDTRDPKPVIVMGEGKSKLIYEAKCNECDCLQEPLPESMRVLLCLIDGAERRRSLMMRWSGQAP